MFCRSTMRPLQPCSMRRAMARRKNWIVSIVSRPWGSRMTMLLPTYSEIFIRAFFLPVHAQEEGPSAHVLQIKGLRRHQVVLKPLDVLDRLLRRRGDEKGTGIGA